MKTIFIIFQVMAGTVVCPTNLTFDSEVDAQKWIDELGQPEGVFYIQEAQIKPAEEEE